MNTTEQNDRQRYIEQLYLLDGRQDPGHPMHGLFTGLYVQRMEALKAADQETLLAIDRVDPNDESPLHELLGQVAGDGVFRHPDGAAMVSSMWCRLLATHIATATHGLNPVVETRSWAVKSLHAVVDWLRHEAVRAETSCPPAAPAQQQNRSLEHV